MPLKYPVLLTVTTAAVCTTCTFFTSKKPYLSVVTVFAPTCTVAFNIAASFSSVTKPETEAAVTFVVRSGGVTTTAPPPPFSRLNSFWQEKNNMQKKNGTNGLST